MDDFHVRQLTDFCGPAAIRMILKRNGIRDVTQKEIAYTYGVFVPHWGSPPDNMLSCLKMFFDDCGLKTDTTHQDLLDYIRKGFHLITYFQDDLPDEYSLSRPYEHTGEHGHIVVITAVSPDKEWIEVSDPTNAKRQYTSLGYVVTEADPMKELQYREKYKIRWREFEKRWWDVLEDGSKLNHGVLWIDPSTKKRHTPSRL